MLPQFSSIFDLLKAFPDEQSCINHLETLIWDGVPVSPFDSTSKVYKCSGIKYKCKNTGKYFNIKTGSIFEDSKIPLQKWFMALYLFTSHKKGISSHQLSRDISVTQKSAWFMLHRLRYAFDHPAFKAMMGGTVCIDEAYIGGKSKNKHKNKRIKHTQGRNLADKIAVFGIKEQDGVVRTTVVKNVKQESLVPVIYANIEPDSTIHTDDWLGYGNLSRHYEQAICNHSGGQYVNPDNGATTNPMENYWSHMKRSIMGCYHKLSRKHCERYLREWEYRFNTRTWTICNRFNVALKNIIIGHLPYKTLIA